MKFPLKLALLIIFAAPCCAKSRGENSEKPTQSAKPPGFISVIGSDSLTNIISLPTETFLVGGHNIPNRLNATTLGDAGLVLQFRSNVADATFQCRSDAPLDFVSCENYYDFGRLVHGRAYMLAVRARSPDGILDGSPIIIEFTVDNFAGDSLQLGQGNDFPETPDDLPPPLSPDVVGKPDDENPLASRALQVGSFYGVVAPFEMVVTSYATSKTYNHAVRHMRLLDDSLDQNWLLNRQALPACDGEFERILPGAATFSGQAPLTYCDATPPRRQLIENPRGAIPFNHVELVRRTSEAISEILLVTAFDAEPDPAESQIDLEQRCKASPSRGQVAIPLLSRFLDVTAAVETFTWCQLQDPDGTFWWAGTFFATLSDRPSPNQPRLKVIYLVNADAGIRSGVQFAARATTILPQLIVPLAPSR